MTLPLGRYIYYYMESDSGAIFHPGRLSEGNGWLGGETKMRMKMIPPRNTPPHLQTACDHIDRVYETRAIYHAFIMAWKL